MCVVVHRGDDESHWFMTPSNHDLPHACRLDPFGFMCAMHVVHLIRLGLYHGGGSLLIDASKVSDCMRAARCSWAPHLLHMLYEGVPLFMDASFRLEIN